MKRLVKIRKFITKWLTITIIQESYEQITVRSTLKMLSSKSALIFLKYKKRLFPG